MLSAWQVERYRWDRLPAPKAELDPAAFELHERVYRRYPRKYAEQTTATIAITSARRPA